MEFTPKFKVGDVVRDTRDGYKYLIEKVFDDCYSAACLNDNGKPNGAYIDIWPSDMDPDYVCEAWLTLVK